MKQIFIDNLPCKKGFGKNKDKIIIDWINSINCIIPFIYEENKGIVWIVNYNPKTQKITIKYKNGLYELTTSQLLKVGLGNIIGKFNCDYKYKVGDIIKTELGEGEVIELLRNNSSGRRYKIKCLRCDKTYERDEGKILDVNRSVKCPHCSNGSKSFCERFIYSLLSKLNLNVKSEFTPKWSKGKRYDFYFKFNGEEYIIEVHGVQHYEYTGFNRSLREEQENDKYKYELALSNGIKPENYIIIDFRESTLEWGKEHILNSRLNEIFDLSSIDWLQCLKASSIGSTLLVIDAWNRGYKTSNEISKVIGLKRGAVVDHLKKAQLLGECLDYDPQKETKTAYKKSLTPLLEEKRKRVLCIETGIVFNSIRECEKQMNLTHVSDVCKGIRQHSKNYHFKFIEDNTIDNNEKVNKNYDRIVVLWNEGKSSNEICKILNMNRDTVKRWLKISAEKKDTNYSTKESQKRGNEISRKTKNLKSIIIYDLQDNFIEEFVDMRDLLQKCYDKFGVQFSQSCISAVCSGKRKSHKGYKFKYKEEK